MNLVEHFLNQTATIGEMMMEFAPLAKIMQGAPSNFKSKVVFKTIVMSIIRRWS